MDSEKPGPWKVWETAGCRKKIGRPRKIVEVCNRYFWCTLVTYNFQINKKVCPQPPKSLTYTPNISMTPIYTNK